MGRHYGRSFPGGKEKSTNFRVNLFSVVQRMQEHGHVLKIKENPVPA